uniref:AB hydrolase-1 domain-containing protein n=1 Tax=Aegilops tauschii subsp. strangulata TaxID=200361 RepID=A0A453MBM9_AEGTS
RMAGAVNGVEAAQGGAAAAIRHRTVEANGIAMHVAESGPEDGPAVLFLHGFPELWYSWRHQMAHLAARGYRCVAPDLRGYGGTEAPADVASYTAFHVVGDAVALLDALGIGKVSTKLVIPRRVISLVIMHRIPPTLLLHLCQVRVPFRWVRVAVRHTLTNGAARQLPIRSVPSIGPCISPSLFPTRHRSGMWPTPVVANVTCCSTVVTCEPSTRKEEKPVNSVTHRQSVLLALLHRVCLVRVCLVGCMRAKVPNPIHFCLFGRVHGLT